MAWLSRWWEAEVLDGHKGPLLLSLVAFVLTFFATRSVTRMIRAGRGPFRNLSNGDVHLHHSTPGTVLLVSGAFFCVGANGRTPWSYASAVLIGVGASLVLDEFAMIFHLKDVYWSHEGQLSVDVATLAAALLGLAVAGVSPLGVTGLSEAAEILRLSLTALLVTHLVFVALTAMKGKYPTALLGIFIAPLTWVAAVRLARPTSLWARWFYSARRSQRAAVRAAEFDRRWAPLKRLWSDLVGGAPSR